MVLASLASMNHLSVPPASVCSGDGCYAVAYAAALHAECTFNTLVFSQATFMEHLGNPNNKKIRCSTFGNATCILVDVNTMFNFTSGPSFACSQGPEVNCPAGDFAIIFGTWIAPHSGGSEDIRMHTVDCPISYGNVMIVKNGTSPPNLDRGSFARSEATLPMTETHTEDSDGVLRNLTDYTAVWLWQATYLRHYNYPATFTSPYTFNVSETIGAYMDPLSRYLLVQELHKISG